MLRGSERALPHECAFSLPRGIVARALGFVQWTYSSDAAQAPLKDGVLDDITLLWLTNSATYDVRVALCGGPT